MSKAHRIIAGLATALLSAALAACSGPVATVNGQAISHADFDTRLEASPVARTTLQQMVQDVLLDQHAKDANIVISDDDLTKRENELKASFPGTSWDDMLKARGITEDEVKHLLRQQMIVDRSVGADIKIGDAQVAQYFARNHVAFDKPEQVCAKHILVHDLNTANAVEAALRGGAKFEDVAKQYSTDPGSKDKGGELGCFRHGQMVPAFDKAVFAMPIGPVSRPVKSPFGYHIVVVESRTPAQKATLADAHDKVVETLRQQQEQPLIQPFLLGLVQKATITVNDPRFQGLFPSPPGAAPSAGAATPAPAATK
jgi:foldase protein PrsA